MFTVNWWLCLLMRQLIRGKNQTSSILPLGTLSAVCGKLYGIQSLHFVRWMASSELHVLRGWGRTELKVRAKLGSRGLVRRSGGYTEPGCRGIELNLSHKNWMPNHIRNWKVMISGHEKCILINRSSLFCSCATLVSRATADKWIETNPG